MVDISFEMVWKTVAALQGERVMDFCMLHDVVYMQLEIFFRALWVVIIKLISIPLSPACDFSEEVWIEAKGPKDEHATLTS